MFNSISWQEFLNTALVALGTYYAVSIVVFYSEDLIARFKARQQGEAHPELGPNRPLMGQIRKTPPRNMSTSSKLRTW